MIQLHILDALVFIEILCNLILLLSPLFLGIFIYQVVRGKEKTHMLWMVPLGALLYHIASMAFLAWALHDGGFY